VDRKQERAFEVFVAESGDSLLRLATLLTSDTGRGEDVYQETLHRLAARWSRVQNPRALRYFDDRSENEVAGLLGVSTGTVKSAASRAMAHLREQPGISGLITQAETDATIRRIGYA
jgi:DNA-directed RNA polymerase specialized sigma24 family protein